MNEKVSNNKVIHPVGVKLTGVKLTDEFVGYKSKIDSVQIKFCALFTQWVREKKVKEITDKFIHFSEDVWSGEFDKSRKDTHPKDELSLRHLKYQAEIEEIIFSTLGVKSLDELATSPLDDSLWYVVERFKSFVNRNSTKKQKKFPKRGITLKPNKATYFKNGSIKINTEDKTVTVKTFFKKTEIKLTYSGSKYGNEDAANGQWCGGNIVYNSLLKAPDNELVLLASIEHDDFPDQTHIVGMDVNLKTSDWVTFSEAISNKKMNLEKPNNIIDLEAERDSLNTQLRPRKGSKVLVKLNSRQRRRKYGTLHKKKENRKTAIAAVLIPELNFLKKKYKNKLGLAIDGVAIGRTPSFGQEDIRDICVKWCLNTKTAFRIVPPQYTSQKCPKCESFHKQDRKTSNMFNCPSCGYCHKNCDEVGALNIKSHGEFLFKKFKITASSPVAKVENPDGGKKVALNRLYGKALREKFNFPTPPQKKRLPQSQRVKRA